MVKLMKKIRKGKTKTKQKMRVSKKIPAPLGKFESNMR